MHPRPSLLNLPNTAKMDAETITCNLQRFSASESPNFSHVIVRELGFWVGRASRVATICFGVGAVTSRSRVFKVVDGIVRAVAIDVINDHPHRTLAQECLGYETVNGSGYLTSGRSCQNNMAIPPSMFRVGKPNKDTGCGSLPKPPYTTKIRDFIEAFKSFYGTPFFKGGVNLGLHRELLSSVVMGRAVCAAPSLYFTTCATEVIT